VAEVPIAGPEGIVRVPEDQLSDDELSTIGAHHNAIGSFLAHTPEADKKVAEFEGVEVAGVQLLTDLDRIEELAADHQLDIEEFYEQGSS